MIEKVEYGTDPKLDQQALNLAMSIPVDESLRDIVSWTLESGGLIILADSVVVATGAVIRDGLDMRLENTIVSADQRRKGFGRALIDALESKARSMDARQSFVMSVLSTGDAIDFYTERGYMSVDDGALTVMEKTIS